MNITVVGGGKVGYYLIKTLLPHGHKIRLIEQDKHRCDVIAEELGIIVFYADGTDVQALEDADIADADIVVAVTGNDEVNLLVCQLAKKHFGVRKTVARVNNPKNEHVFRELGVGPAISSTSLIASVIETELTAKNIKALLNFGGNDINISDVHIDSGSPIINKTVAQLDLPQNCVVVAIIRNERIILPRGNTLIQSGDEMLILADREGKEGLERLIVGGKGI